MVSLKRLVLFVAAFGFMVSLVGCGAEQQGTPAPAKPPSNMSFGVGSGGVLVPAVPALQPTQGAGSGAAPEAASGTGS